MMSFFIGLLTVVLVLDCLLLILLVLIQLPKKEAGAGIAFGGGATDALFGAGSGNALTKITKYAAGAFLGLSLVLSVMRANHSQEGSRKLEEELRKKAAAAPLAAQPLTPTNSASTGIVYSLMTSSSSSNTATTNISTAAPATNPPAAPSK